MKRYFLFAGDNYYPQRGMTDFINSFDEIELALEEAANLQCDWWHIYDTLYDSPQLVKNGTR
jgi:hypothetical protein